MLRGTEGIGVSWHIAVLYVSPLAPLLCSPSMNSSISLSASCQRGGLFHYVMREYRARPSASPRTRSTSTPRGICIVEKACWSRLGKTGTAGSIGRDGIAVDGALSTVLVLFVFVWGSALNIFGATPRQ